MLWALFLLLKAKKGGKVLDSIFLYVEKNGEITITGLQEGTAETAVEIPETIDNMPVTEIAEQAFLESPITAVKIGKNIREIGELAFGVCKKLSSVTWNQKCDVIPSDCFAECSNLTQFDFSNVKKIGLYAFYKSGLQEVYLTEKMEILDKGTFSGCSKLQSVTWHCQCDVIPADCFFGCSDLMQFDFSGVKKIEARAFMGSGLTSVRLSKKTAVEQSCFACCNDLEKIEWLSDRNIEKTIFAECKNIKEIFISDKVKNIEVSAFTSSHNAEITFV